MHALLHGRPAVKILLPFLAGITCAHFYSVDWRCAAALTVLSVVLAFWAGWQGAARPFALLILIAFFSAGWMRLAFTEQVVAANDVRRMADWPAPVSLEGVITAPVEFRGDRQIFRLTVDSLWTEEQGFAASGHSRIIYYDSLIALRQGDRLVVKGMLRRPADAHNPGDFDYRAWLAGEGIHTQLTAAGRTQLLLLERDQDPFLQRALIRPMREHILRVIGASLEGEHAALLSALLVGVRSGIDDELRQEFSTLGVVHVLAVSGLHVGFILAALLLCINVLRVPHRARLPLLLVALYLYALITGSAAPVVRAAVMAALLLAAPLFQRRLDPLNAIALAAFIIVLLRPLALFSIGFQLSFSAALGIILIYRRLDRGAAAHSTHWRRQEQSLRKAALQRLVVSFAAQIATLPLTAWYFNIVPLYGLLANLAVVPMVSLIVTIGFVAVLFAAAAPAIGIIFMQCDWLLLTALIWIVKKAAALPGAALEVAAPPLLILAIFYLAVAAVLSWPRRKPLLVWLTMLLVAANIWIWSEAVRPPKEVEVIYFDVGQGDAALISFPNQVHLLIDTGEANQRFDCGQALLIPWLRRHGIRAVDGALITHTHSDHAGGAKTLLRQGRIRTLYHPGGLALPVFHSLDSLAECCGVPVRPVAAGWELFPVPGAWIRILHTGGGTGEPWDENNGSMVIRFQYGRYVFLFLADIEAAGEAGLLPYGDLLHSHVVKVAHHGSVTASSQELIEASAARYAVISVGQRNRFNLPSPSVMARWQAAGATVLRTDLSGAIIFSTDGDTLRCIRPE